MLECRRTFMGWLMATREDLQNLAEQRLAEAKVLLREGRNSGAYYLAGYAIEFGLKSCIAKTFQPHAIPNRAFVNDVHTHDLAKLVKLAGLSPDLEKASQDTTFAARWGVVSNWGEASRYEFQDAVAATALVSCCEEVLKWIRPHW